MAAVAAPPAPPQEAVSEGVPDLSLLRDALPPWTSAVPAPDRTCLVDRGLSLPGGAADVRVGMACGDGVPRAPSVEAAGARAADGPGAASRAGDGPSYGYGDQLHARNLVPTPRWYALAEPLGAPAPDPDLADGGWVRVHGYGDVAAHDADGRVRWARDARSLQRDWGIDSRRVPIVPMGYDPLDPFALASERPFATVDVTGDGTRDVVVAHLVRLDEERRWVSVVSLLDGRDGTTLWHARHDGHVTQVLAGAGGHVWFAEELGPLRGDEAPSTGPDGRPAASPPGTTVHALRLDAGERPGDGSGVTARALWSTRVGPSWARTAALEPLDATAGGRGGGDGGPAPGPAAAPAAVAVAVVDEGTTSVRVLGPAGDLRWIWVPDGYPRALRLDAVRGELLVHVQSQPVGDLSYDVVALDADRGRVVRTVHRSDALLLGMAVGDAARASGPEWVLADLEVDTDTLGPTRPVAGRVAVMSPSAPGGPGGADAVGPADLVEPVDGTDAGTGTGTGSDAPVLVWSHEERCDTPQTCWSDVPWPYGLLVRDGLVHVGVWAPDGTGPADGPGATELWTLQGADGTLRWRAPADAAFPLGLAPVRVDGRPAVLTVTPDLLVRAYAARDGAVLLEVPLLHDLYAVAVHDVDGDGDRDLVAGGASRTVFALDGGDLDAAPGILWATVLPGPVRHLELADVDGDGRPEAAVAHTNGFSVLDLADGRVRAHVPVHRDLVWTLTTGDVSGDGQADVVVPTRTLAAYGGQDGRPLWTYRPPVAAGAVGTHFANAVVLADGTVASQYLLSVQDATNLAPRHHHVAVAVRPDGEAAWTGPVVDPGHPRLWRSVAALPPGAVPGADGPVVAVTYAAGDAEVDAGETSLRRWGGPTVDLLDADDGLRRAKAGPLRLGGFHMGLVPDGQTGLVEFNWFGAAGVGPDGAVEADVGATADLGVARSADGSRALVSAWSAVVVHTGYRGLAAPGDAEALGSGGVWHEVGTGALVVSDLDGDGTDEVVAHPFDWPGFRRVVAQAGIHSYGYDLLPHGLAVLSLRPATAGDGDPAGAGPADLDGLVANAAAVAAVAAVGLGAWLRRR